LRDRLLITVIASRRQARAETIIAHSPGERAPVAEQTPTLPRGIVPDLEAQMLTPAGSHRPASRFVAPPPPLTPEKREQLLNQQAASGARQRKTASKMRQGQLPLEIISKGRFEKSEPTIHHGQDLDVPTYIRRGVALN